MANIKNVRALLRARRKLLKRIKSSKKNNEVYFICARYSVEKAFRAKRKRASYRRDKKNGEEETVLERLGK